MTAPKPRDTAIFLLGLALLVLWLTWQPLAAAVVLLPLPFTKLRLALYLAWMWLTRPLRWLVPRIALGLVYYLVLTPIGLALGRGRLGRGKVRRHETKPDLERYFRQY